MTRRWSEMRSLHRPGRPSGLSCVRGVDIQERAAFKNTTSWWHGPYETRERAEREAERLALELALCRSCIPAA